MYFQTVKFTLTNITYMASITSLRIPLDHLLTFIFIHIYRIYIAPTYIFDVIKEDKIIVY